MARTTIDDVKSILPTGHSLTDTQINAVIDAATCVVDQLADCASHLSEECLKQVETWLAAHYLVPLEPSMSRTSERDPCGGSASYSFQSGTGVLSSRYGQMANTLSGGCLAELDKQPANLFSIGCT